MNTNMEMIGNGARNDRRRTSCEILGAVAVAIANAVLTPPVKKRGRTRMRIVTLALTILIGASAAVVQAQDDREAMAVKAANPIANLMSIPLQNNVDFGLGRYDRNSDVLNFQPVIPLADGKLITRTILPFVWVPDLTAESGLVTKGLSDILFTAFYVPGGGSTMWGVGPVLEIPTGGSKRGTEKWSAGLSGVVLAQPGDWTLGLLANNVWSFAGDSEAESVNKGMIQYFIVYQLGKGWYVNSAPIISADWNASEGNKWRVPFGIGGGKLMFLGKLPVNLQSQVYYYVEAPEIGPDWQLRIQLQFFLPMPGGKG